MKFETKNDAVAFLTKEFIKREIVRVEDQQKEIDDIYESISPAVRSTFGDSKEVCVANFYPTYIAGMENKPSGGVPQTSVAAMQTGGAAVPGAARPKFVKLESFPQFTSAESQAFEEMFKRNQQSRIENTSLTYIEKLLVENEDPAIVLATMTVIPDIEKGKLDKYREKLVQDAENIKAFDAIAAAVNNKALPVYINKKNRKVSGYKVMTPTKDPGRSNLENRTLTQNGLVGFLIMDVYGKISTNHNGLGVKLAYATKKENVKRQASGEVVGKPKLNWVGMSSALENPEMLEVINERVQQGGFEVHVSNRLRIDASFKIVSDKPKADGTERILTVRLTGKTTEYPKYQRRQEYVQMFGSVKDPKVIPAEVTDKEIEASKLVTAQLMHMAANKQLTGGDSEYGNKFKSAIEALRSAMDSAGANVASDFAG